MRIWHRVLRNCVAQGAEISQRIANGNRQQRDEHSITIGVPEEGGPMLQTDQAGNNGIGILAVLQAAEAEPDRAGGDDESDRADRNAVGN